MGRPTNQEIYDRPVELEEGTEQAVATVVALNPDNKILEAEVVLDAEKVITGYEVVVGSIDGAGIYHVTEIQLDEAYVVVGKEERPDVPPGHLRKDKGLKARKPHAKVKQ